LASLLALFQSIAPIRHVVKIMPIGEEIEALLQSSRLDYETTSGFGKGGIIEAWRIIDKVVRQE
jgi:hypothetical protein